MASYQRASQRSLQSGHRQIVQYVLTGRLLCSHPYGLEPNPTHLFAQIIRGYWEIGLVILMRRDLLVIVLIFVTL